MTLSITATNSNDDDDNDKLKVVSTTVEPPEQASAVSEAEVSARPVTPNNTSPRTPSPAPRTMLHSKTDNWCKDDNDNDNDHPTKTTTTTAAVAALASPPKQQQEQQEHVLSNDFRMPASFSECLYGVPEDDELWERFFVQPQPDDDYVLDADVGQEEQGANGGQEEKDFTLVNDIWKRQARVRGHTVNVSQLRRLAALGIPDEGSHRGVVWRLLLTSSTDNDFMPLDNIDKWQDSLRQKRQTYFTLASKRFLWNDWHFGHALRVQRKQEHVQRMMQQYGSESPVLSMNVDDEYQSFHIIAKGGSGSSNGADDQDDHHQYDSEFDTDQPSAATLSMGGSNSPTRSHRPQQKQQQQKQQEICPQARNCNRHKPMRPAPFPFFDNPAVLEEQHVSQVIQTAWTERGKDLHILASLMKSFNALQIPAGETPTQDQVDEFVDSAILLDEIHKDVIRTHSDLAFFLDPHDDLGRRRYAAIERILFVWAKYNTSGVRYVQGMNEIVGALYYVLANDLRTEWANAAEPDAFWILSALLEDMRDVFVPELDAVDTGIRGRISALQDLLERHDPVLHHHFYDVGIHASFYAVRWLTTLLSREFLLPDTIRLWDSMFASTHRENFLKYVCVTMLFMIRDQLLQNDFGGCIQLLQQYPSTHVDRLLEASRALYVYEMQITVACHKAGLSQHDALLTIAPPPYLIMAFGFFKGMVPQPTFSSSDRMQNATRAVASSARNFYRRVFSRGGRSQSGIEDYETTPSTERIMTTMAPEASGDANALPPPPRTPQRSQSAPTETLSSSSSFSGEHQQLQPPESPDIYMKAIMGLASSSP